MEILLNQMIENFSEQIIISFNVMISRNHYCKTLVAIFSFRVVFFVKQVVILYVFEYFYPVVVNSTKVPFQIQICDTKIIADCSTALILVEDPIYTLATDNVSCLVFKQKLFIKRLMMLYNDYFPQNCLQTFVLE
jgi:hypothetical protein